MKGWILSESSERDICFSAANKEPNQINHQYVVGCCRLTRYNPKPDERFKKSIVTTLTNLEFRIYCSCQKVEALPSRITRLFLIQPWHLESMTFCITQSKQCFSRKTYFLPFQHNAECQNRVLLVLVSRSTCNANYPQIYLQEKKRQQKKITKHDFWCRKRSKRAKRPHIIIPCAPSDMISISDFGGMALRY